MPEWLMWRRVAAVALALGVLAGTHVLAYWLGARQQFNRTSSFVQSLSAGYEKDALRHRVQALRIMAKHMQQTPTDEVLAFCRTTETIADAVERETVAPARQAGNDPEADRWQRQVEEARQLCARLKREKR
jgi:uncharacterized protein YbjQ (UPF0145 family)